MYLKNIQTDTKSICNGNVFYDYPLPFPLMLVSGIMLIRAEVKLEQLICAFFTL